ncbi:hypothetical protein [Gracilibacillus salinarum]|uniref:Uncharacterized protein n=1 Tax=Gracilibacillus salinarum TaxID=2932255 RepID=A0ABY4GLP4_9BACI|nr:hypothetical protein [Gracilibacillus salinarum]UOQ84662.1 hypothetical protein MUN87_18685 [Gracilibacillus salinarum]
MSLELEVLNKEISNEAYDILYENGFYDLLRKFGNPQISGSYFLQLMTWRDLDIYLESESINVTTFFELGKEITDMMNPAKMIFRNELMGNTPGLPNGLYWGFIQKFLTSNGKSIYG